MPASTASANSSHISLPGSLSSALSWTFNRWSTGSSSSSTWGTSSTSLHPENAYSSNRSSYPPSQPSSRPPSRRRASPFQPPPLPPLSLQGYSSSTSSHLLTPTLAEEIRQLIPARLQLYDSWELVYSLEQHGVSLTTLYERCSKKEFAKGGFVLVIKDDAGGVFGAFVNEGFRVSGGRYYGTGECFLWKSGWVKSYKSVHAQGNGSVAGNNNLLHHHHHHHQHHHHRIHSHHHHQNESRRPNGEEKEENLIDTEIEPLGEKTRNIDDEQRPYSSSSRVGTPVSIASSTTTNNENVLKFKAFPYSGVNEYFILCEQGFLSVGGGNGKFGLWLDNNFEKGVSSTCPTFGNEPLSEDGEKFEIIGVELWSIGGSF